MNINKNKSICIIGLGFVGLTLATVMANGGFKIYGVEKNKFILELVKSTRWPDDEVANKLKPSEKWVSKNTDNDRQQYNI